MFWRFLPFFGGTRPAGGDGPEGGVGGGHPTLSALSVLANGAFGFSATFDTDTVGGHAYSVISPSAAAPLGSQIKNGQIHTGAEAIVDTDNAVTVGGEQHIGAVSGLAAGATYYAHIVQQLDNGNYSNILTGVFTTNATPSNPDLAGAYHVLGLI